MSKCSAAFCLAIRIGGLLGIPVVIHITAIAVIYSIGLNLLKNLNYKVAHNHKI